MNRQYENNFIYCRLSRDDELTGDSNSIVKYIAGNCPTKYFIWLPMLTKSIVLSFLCILAKKANCNLQLKATENYML